MSYAIPLHIPIYTVETLLARNGAPFKAVSQFRPGVKRSRPSHLRPNKPSRDHTAFYTRISIRRLRAQPRRQAMKHGKWRVYWRDEYVVSHFEYAICAIHWDTAAITELQRFATRDEALNFLQKM